MNANDGYGLANEAAYTALGVNFALLQQLSIRQVHHPYAVTESEVRRGVGQSRYGHGTVFVRQAHISKVGIAHFRAKDGSFPGTSSAGVD